MTAKSESLKSNRPDNKHMNVWELYILDTIDWNVEAKPTLLLWETISTMNEILAMAFQFWQPDISQDIKLFKEGTIISLCSPHLFLFFLKPHRDRFAQSCIRSVRYILLDYQTFTF